MYLSERTATIDANGDRLFAKLWGAGERRPHPIDIGGVLTLQLYGRL